MTLGAYLVLLTLSIFQTTLAIQAAPFSAQQFASNWTQDAAPATGAAPNGDVLQLGLHDVNRDGTTDLLWTDTSAGLLLCHLRSTGCASVGRLHAAVSKFAFFANGNSSIQLALVQRLAEYDGSAKPRAVLFAQLLRGNSMLSNVASNSVNSTIDSDVLAFDVDRDDRVDFLHPLNVDQSSMWSQQVVQTGGAGGVTFRFHNHDYDGPMRPYQLAIGSTDRLNRQVLSTFTHQYMYTRWFNDSGGNKAYGVKSWPPLVEQDACCKQCTRPPCADSYYDPCTDMWGECDKRCVCPADSGRVNVPILQFPDCGLWTKTFHLHLDCDNDEFSDVVIACNGQTPRIFRNDRLGNFAEVGTWPANVPEPITGGDIIDANEDGFFDLVIVSEDSNTDSSLVTVLINQGTCSFVPFTLSTGQSMKRPTSLAVTDFSGDGADDIVLIGTKIYGLVNKRPATRGDSLTVQLRDVVNGVTPWGARITLVDAETSVPFATHHVNPSLGQLRPNGERKTFFWRAGEHRFVTVIARLPSSRDANVTVIGIPVGTRVVNVTGERIENGKLASSVHYFAPPPPSGIKFTAVATTGLDGAQLISITGVSGVSTKDVYRFQITASDDVAGARASLSIVAGKFWDLSTITSSASNVITGSGDLNHLSTVQFAATPTKNASSFNVVLTVLPAVDADKQAQSGFQLSVAVAPATRSSGAPASATTTSSTSSSTGTSADGASNANAATTVVTADKSGDTGLTLPDVGLSDSTVGASGESNVSNNSSLAIDSQDEVIGDGLVAGIDWWLWIVIGVGALLLLVGIVAAVVIARRRRASNHAASSHGHSEIAAPQLIPSANQYHSVPRGPGAPPGYDHVGNGPFYDVVHAIPPPIAPNYDVSDLASMDHFQSFRNESEAPEYITLPSSNNSSNQSNYRDLPSWR